VSRDVVRAVRRRWIVVLMVAVIVVVPAAIYVNRLPDEYRAVAVVGIVARGGRPFPGAEYVGIDAARYIAYATAPVTLKSIAAQTLAPSGGDATALQDAVDVTLATETSNLTISVRSGTPVHAAWMANAIANAIVAYSDSDTVLKATLVARAPTPKQPAGPSRHADLAIVGMAGLFAGVAAAVVLEVRHAKIVDWRDLAAIDDVPLLAVIPRPSDGDGDGDGDDREISPYVVLAARRVAAALLADLDTVPPVLAVTSVTASGKSILARAIASEMHAAGRRTLLLQTDTAANGNGAWWRFWRHNREGASEVPVRRDRRRHITIEADPRTPVGEHLAAVRRRGGGAVEAVVVDAPPVTRSEGLALISQSTRVAVVVPRGATVHEVQETMHLLAAIDADVVGLVGDGLD
jgi:capsular polysaccharide biosynthesis protein